MPYITVTIIVLNALAWFYELALPRDELPLFLQRLRRRAGRSSACRRSSRRCSCTAAGRTSSATCGTCGSSATTSKTALGHGRFVVFYLLCGIVAALGQIAMDPQSTLPTIGASGAIAGVMGAYFVLYPHSRVLTLIPLIIFWEIIELPAIFLLGFWFLMQLFSAGAIAVDGELARRRRRRLHGARRRLRRGTDRRLSSSGSGRTSALSGCSAGTPVIGTRDSVAALRAR